MFSTNETLDFIYNSKLTSQAGLKIAIEFIAQRLSTRGGEIDRIRSSKIFVVETRSPGVTLPKALFPNDKEFLVCIDKEMCELCDFGYEEKAALIMHEIGHILNDAPEERKSEVEYFADNYAKQNGFGIYLLKAHRKYCNSNLTIVSADSKSEYEARIKILEGDCTYQGIMKNT